MKTNTIICGDCIEELKRLEENSVDAIITDPPYGIGFMGKEWDNFKPSFIREAMEKDTRPKTQIASTRISNAAGTYDLSLNGNQKFQLWWEQVAKECLRVLKYGGFLLSFGGTRTYHRLVCGIEDAGFEIRDTIMWLYGSGFPKSLNVSKAIEREREKIFLEPITKGKNDFESGLFPEEVKFCEWIREKSGLTQKDLRDIVGHDRFYTGKVDIVNTATTENPLYGRRCNVPTSNAWKIIKEKIKVEIPEEIEELVKKEAEGFLRGPGQEQTWQSGKGEGTKSYNEWGGWGTALKPACEPIVVARKPLSEKNVALNVLKHGTGGINIDACRIKCDKVLDKSQDRTMIQRVDGKEQGWGMKPQGKTQVLDLNKGRFPANIILDEEAGSLLGEASRFFYCAKASKSERNFGCRELEDKEAGIRSETSGQHITRRDGGDPKSTKNNHPTVKPIVLMEYLIKLVTPKDGIVLDPFLGSGTTAIASLKLNRKFIGIEKEEDYIKIAEARIKPFLEQTKL